MLADVERALPEECGSAGVYPDGRTGGFKFAVKKVPASREGAVGKAELTTDDITCFILHQANRRIVEAVAKRLRAGHSENFQ